LTRKTLIFGLLLSFIAGLSLTGQESDESSLEQIIKDALSINIHASLSQNERNVLWESELDKLTVSGRPVTVHLSNKRAKLSVHFTPFRKIDGGLVLVAQSEIWLLQEKTETTPEGIRYYTSMKSIPLEFSETVLFFPLGKMDNLNNPEKLHVEMAVMISPYYVNGEAASADVAPESSENSTAESVN